jgi:hypothetical protein
LKTLYSILFLFSFSTHLSAQALIIDSTRFITGNNCCTGINYAIPTADKGILFVGVDNNNPGGIIPYFPIDTVLENVLIGKIDSNHQISWIKVYGGSEDDGAFNACQTPDGGYAVLAATMSSNGDVTGYLGGGDIWLLRIDGNGNLLWEKCYGSSQSDVPMSVAVTPDNGFIILGATNGSDDDVPFHYGDFFSFDWLVIKTDSVGSLQWSKDLGGTGDEGQNGSILPVDSSYYLISYTNSTDHDCTDTAWHPGVNTGYDYYVLKLNDTGAVLWDSSYGGSAVDASAYALFDTRDSTIMITGTTGSDDYMVTGYHECLDVGDMWVLKVSLNGTIQWEKTLGSVQQETGTGICIASGGGYIAYGSTHRYNCYDSTIGDIGGEDCWLFALDNTGNQTTNKVFGGTSGDYPSSIVPYLNSYAATGASESLVFTEGTTYGDFDGIGGAFISYFDYWPLAINNVPKNEEQIFVYPNPSENSVRITTPANENGEIIIMNSIGQIIYTEKIKTIYMDLNTNEWVNGMYLIKWQGEDGMVLTTKLVKN